MLSWGVLDPDPPPCIPSGAESLEKHTAEKSRKEKKNAIQGGGEGPEPGINTTQNDGLFKKCFFLEKAEIIIKNDKMKVKKERSPQSLGFEKAVK